MLVLDIDMFGAQYPERYVYAFMLGWKGTVLRRQDFSRSIRRKRKAK